MRKSAILPVVLLLAACGRDGTVLSDALEQRLQNPLYAERYYDSLVDQMTNLVIQNDPLLEKEGMADVVEQMRVSGLEQAKAATAVQAEGAIGGIVSDYEYAYGEALLLDGKVYTGPDFETVPGPELHAYLSTMNDPRFDGRFPEEGSVDLGIIQNTFGAQVFTVPTLPEEGTGSLLSLRSFVLYDAKLDRIYGFAQLRRRR